MEKEIIKMYLDGDSALVIEKRTGINYKRVYRILKDNGIKTRNYREMTLNAIKQGRDSHSEKHSKITSDKWMNTGNPRWKPIGTIRKTKKYTYIKVGNNEWIKEERYIMQKKLKRQLEFDEVVHHKNRNKSDNRLANLRVMKDVDHRKLHANLLNKI